MNNIKMVVDDVDHTNCIAKSRASLEALRSATLLKNIKVNALIGGESGVGKKTLATHITDAPIVNGANFNELSTSLHVHQELIIKDFDKISQPHTLKELLQNHKIVATSSKELNNPFIDDFFSIKITLPPLSERVEDIEPLMKKFFTETLVLLNESSEFSIKNFTPDISENCHSLRRSIIRSVLANGYSEDDILDILQIYLSKNLKDGKEYRDLLHLFDVPIIRAGFKLFGSQMGMSDKLMLNRNTLRKKIGENRKYF